MNARHKLDAEGPARQKLTDRQALIYRLLTEKGLTVRQVSTSLNIATQTVYETVAAIKRKGYEIEGKEGTDGERANVR